MTPVTRPDDRIMAPTIALWARYADYLQERVAELEAQLEKKKLDKKKKPS